jgi:hypothetical protein
MRLRPILVRRTLKADGAEARNLLNQFGLRVQKRMQTYPTWTGSYRRTGNLGRNWNTRQLTIGNDIRQEILNRVEYARNVQGFLDEQLSFHREHGWVSIEDVMREEWAEVAPHIRKALAGNA